MLPSRGLRPAQFVPLASRQSAIARTGASRKFSSIPRTASLATPSSRTSPLQPPRWRVGAAGNPHVHLTASSVRYGSWYAPWSWGKSSTPDPNTVDPSSLPSGTEHVRIAEISNRPLSEFAQKHAEPVVTSSTPELAPAGIDKPAVVNSTADSTATATDNATSSIDQATLDEILRLGVEQAPKVEFDPTKLIDHAGNLQELGLDYGWGMTTMYGKLIEQIYLQTGWGWAGSIVTAGVVVRFITFYFQAKTSNNMAVMSALGPITKPLQAKMEAALAAGDKQQAEMFRMQQSELMKPYVGGFLATGGFMLMQAWIGFSAFRFLRAMSELPVPGMSQDGILWITDLSLRDPYYILPAATSAIMYTVFKTGGETGISSDAEKAATRQNIFTGFSVLIGVVTAFQASALQLYFLTSAILGGITGKLLRNNGFRRMIGIKPIPSKQSNEIYTKVVKGELKLNDIKGPDGRIRYQAPSPTAKPSNRRAATTLTGIKVKAGTSIPLHLRSDTPKANSGPRDREADFEEGATGKPLAQKVDYYRRNYKPSYMWRRLTKSLTDMAKKQGYVPTLSPEQQRRQRLDKEYEAERKRRFESRR